MAGAVTLDLWHTLIYLDPAAEEAYMRAQIEIAVDVLRAAPLAGPGPRPDDRALAELFRQSYRAAVDASEQGRTITPDDQLLRAGREAGVRPDLSAYHAALRRVIATLRFSRAPGAIETLRALRGAGYRVAVISNTVGEPGALLRPVLARMGLDECVERYVFSDESPWTKPAPEIFRYALDGLGVSAVDAVHVGDGWADMEGARRTGYRATILFTGLPDYGAEYRRLFARHGPESFAGRFSVRALTEVPAIVERVLGGAPR
ncbi:MAG TPA: HAD family hydrolase [Thermoplasmata archaeon]|nr:HAD family hydrolase [Thermoplasmata archaeon]HTW55439.1 HAD family hydrolase [Thermoplasmata archaeon]